MDLAKLPSTFYRVTIKAIICDDEGRLLVGRAGDDTWEVPGGGWEHGESFDGCIKREIKEELGVEIAKIGSMRFTYFGQNPGGPILLRIATDIELDSLEFKLGDLMEARFVSKNELLKLNFVPNEAGIKDCVDDIWPN